MDIPTKQHILKIKVQPTMSNLEDYFNDLVEDGFTVDEALKTIVKVIYSYNKPATTYSKTKIKYILKNNYYY